METNIKDYKHDFWIISFTLESSSNFFAIFFSLMIIIYSFTKKSQNLLESEQNDYENANLQTNKSHEKPKINDFTFNDKSKIDPINKDFVNNINDDDNKCLVGRRNNI